MSVAGKTETFNIFGTRQFISWLIKKRTNSKKQTNKKNPNQVAQHLVQFVRYSFSSLRANGKAARVGGWLLGALFLFTTT